MVIPNYEQYCSEAEYCMQMAQTAPTEELRVNWLRLAGKWLAMIPHGPGAHSDFPSSNLDGADSGYEDGKKGDFRSH